MIYQFIPRSGIASVVMELFEMENEIISLVEIDTNPDMP